MKNPQIALYPISKEAGNQLMVWRNNPSIMRWCRQPTHLDFNQHADWMAALGKDPKIKMWGIYIPIGEVPKDVRPTDSLQCGMIGVCGLTDISHLHQRAEFSLYVGPEYQGKGYGKAALAELLRIGFNDLNLAVIWGETFDGNPAAKMFERLGFVKEGTRRDFYWKDGKHIDAHLYSIRRDEWRLYR